MSSTQEKILRSFFINDEPHNAFKQVRHLFRNRKSKFNLESDIRSKARIPQECSAHTENIIQCIHRNIMVRCMQNILTMYPTCVDYRYTDHVSNKR